jgi:hypothetical protein
MSFDFLTSSYLQYKSDTDAVAKWLVIAAKSCGFPVDTLGVSSPASNGKGKKQAAKTTKTQPGSKHVIALKDFVSLADYIAASTKPAVRVPASSITVLDRAISVRRNHGIQAEANLAANPEAQESASRHKHFIGILEHVRQTLRPRISSENIKDSLTQRSSDDRLESNISDLASRPHGLDVEEPSETFLQAHNVAIPIHNDGSPCVEYGVEQTWERYRLGMFDIVPAFLTTNCAIDFAGHIEEEIKQLPNEHGGTTTILGDAYVAMCLLEREDPGARR